MGTLDEAESATQTYRQNSDSLARLKSNHQQLLASQQSLQERIRNLQTGKSEIRLVIEELEKWQSTDDSQLYDLLQRCRQKEQPVTKELLVPLLPSRLVQITKSPMVNFSTVISHGFLEQLNKQLSNQDTNLNQIWQQLIENLQFNSTRELLRQHGCLISFDSQECCLGIRTEAEGKVCLQALCELSDETITIERKATLNQKNAEIEARLEKIRQKTLEIAKVASTEQKNSTVEGTAVQLRDGQIPQAFSEVLNSAQRQILIYSPWVSQKVVDEQFLHLLQTLANRGVWILIGHGIARRQEDEDKPIPPEVEEKLRGVKTPDGLPAIQVFWLGNSHVKEVIVDGKIHLCGSHNWLSYRGDYVPRGESVYKVTIPHQVQEAYEFLADRFKNHAQKLWENAVQNRDFQLATDTLCMWGALGMEEMALQAIQQNNWLELLPVWLNVVLEGVRSKKISVDSASFRTALSLLDEVSTEAGDIKSLRQGWRKVIGAIATNNPQQALNLVSDEVWAQFVRLSITQPPVKTPEQFIVAYTPSQNMPRQSQKRRGEIP